MSKLTRRGVVTGAVATFGAAPVIAFANSMSKSLNTVAGVLVEPAGAELVLDVAEVRQRVVLSEATRFWRGHEIDRSGLVVGDELVAEGFARGDQLEANLVSSTLRAIDGRVRASTSQLLIVDSGRARVDADSMIFRHETSQPYRPELLSRGESVRIHSRRDPLTGDLMAVMITDMSDHETP